ncbi:hypothetical protein GE061_005822 [Apolygus lucorum]|uniref:Uncharacterized protein n=1 Tax=Apolygus lucorum TaxID=248454 RepID=A0A8S9WYR8_APOLU|nr:hypothetical protein GE061_005822 [Apolygus lucorum]
MNLLFTRRELQEIFNTKKPAAPLRPRPPSRAHSQQVLPPSENSRKPAKQPSCTNHKRGHMQQLPPDRAPLPRLPIRRKADRSRVLSSTTTARCERITHTSPRDTHPLTWKVVPIDVPHFKKRADVVARFYHARNARQFEPYVPNCIDPQQRDIHASLSDIVAATVAGGPEGLSSKFDLTTRMVVVLVFLMWAGSAVSSGTSDSSEESTTSAGRTAKSLSFYSPYLDDPQVVLNNVANEFANTVDFNDPLDFNMENEVLGSRSRPGRPKHQDSPVYYIRLPPSPYMLVPGMGYVSRPPQIRPPPVVQPRPNSQIFNLPLNFVSNGKPSSIYTWKQDSPITNLNKGPYNFNGRPTDLFLLRNPFNALYDNGFQNYLQ